MTSKTNLLRQVHPSFIQAGKITSQVFKPTTKDENKLSVYNGDRIKPEDAFEHYCALPRCRSVGILAVTKGECDIQKVPVHEDGIPFPEHCFMNFEKFSKKEIDKIAKFLKIFAEKRGWLYQEKNV